MMGYRAVNNFEHIFSRKTDGWTELLDQYSVLHLRMRTRGKNNGLFTIVAIMSSVLFFGLIFAAI